MLLLQHGMRDVNLNWLLLVWSIIAVEFSLKLIKTSLYIVFKVLRQWNLLVY